MASGGDFGLLVLAVAVAVLAGSPPSVGTRAVLAAIAAIAMGLQTAVVRRLAVPDLTTTVLTMTLTGIAADLRTGGRTPAAVTRLLVVASMLGGAVYGVLLVLCVSIGAALVLAAGVVVVVTAATVAALRRPALWQ